MFAVSLLHLEWSSSSGSLRTTQTAFNLFSRVTHARPEESVPEDQDRSQGRELDRHGDSETSDRPATLLSIYADPNTDGN